MPRRTGTIFAAPKPEDIETPHAKTVIGKSRLKNKIPQILCTTILPRLQKLFINPISILT
jgi:hypothetical protein